MLFKCIFFVCFVRVTSCSQTHVRNNLTANVSDVTISRNITNWKPNMKYNTSTATNSTEVFNKVNIKLYYETLCPASVMFFTRQLKPVLEKLASYVNVELVPYGYAETFKLQTGYRFTCQHGPSECYENKLHACAIDAIQNSIDAVLFNACLMRYSRFRKSFGFDYVSVSNWCGYKLKVSTKGVWECMNSTRGSILLKSYGEQTDAMNPRYVPYLLLNGSTEYEDTAIDNLMSTVCHMLHPSPPSCNSP